MDFKKIVIIIPYRGIGDIIFHLPLLRGLYKKYRSKLTVITNSTNKAKILLKNEKCINKIYYIDFTRENQIKNSYFFLKRLNDFNSDLSVLTAPTKRLIIPLLISNSKKKIFYKKSNIQDLAKYIFYQSQNIFSEINFNRNYQLKVKNNLIFNNVLFVNIDSHHDQNNWGEENFINLIKKVLKKNKIKKIYINFAPSKINKFKKIFDNFNKEKKIFFTYKEKFEEIISYINQSKIIIGNESGPMCIGAALNKKVISIYHPEHTNKSSLIINKKVNFINTKQISAKKIISKILKFL
jgi:ADP-heptose:LPS heptosyltransferase